MMKLFLILFIVLLPLFSASQIYLGYTEKEMMDHIKGSYVKEWETYQDGTLCVTILFKDQKSKFIRRYFFDRTTRRCFLYMLEPVDREALNEFVAYCNKHYVSLSRRKWLTYMNDLNIEVTLKYNSLVQQNFFYFVPVKD